MASSNRHWPSMFKSKPCNTHNQWQHDINSSLMSNACQKTPYASGCEERSPEPKPRWNPKPEQIRILEAIFNSGMVNPPREEIRKIRAQLQEYGQVGDANVFYWFQNRKSRSKHKQRHLQQTPKTQSPHTSSSPTITVPTISSSSSSSEKSSASADKAPALALGGGGGGTPTFIDVVNSPTASVNQTYFQSHADFAPEHWLFQVQPPHGCCFPELSNMLPTTEPAIGQYSDGLLGELMNQEALRKEQEKIKMEQQSQERSYMNASTTISLSSTMNELQGGGHETDSVAASTPAISTVFINNLEFKVGMGPVNVRELFGEEAVLFHSSGQPVLTNEWGVTLHSLQDGAFYYVLNMV